MARLNVTVVRPGAFIDLLHAASPDAVERALMRTVKDLKAPPFTKENVLGLLLVHKAKKTAEAMSDLWSIKLPKLGKTL